MAGYLRKTISILTITLLIIFQSANAYALETPTPPPQPTLPPVGEVQSTPPPAPKAPTPPPSPTLEPHSDQASTSEASNQTAGTLNKDSETKNNSDPQEPVTQGDQTEQFGTNQTDPSADSKVGDTQINTGNGLTTGAVTTEANSTALQQPSQSTGNSTGAENTNNGSGSDNSASLGDESSTNIIQDNSAEVGNNVDLNTHTGGSSASQNVGNSIITTGDANTSGTVVTTANTNAAGLAVSEFNVVDNTQGDLILDFASGCITGCGIFNPVSVTNSGNGTDSTNNTAVNQTVNNETFQNNDAALENNITLTADSGNNQADQNTGGNSTINTGDANVSANILNFLNNNIAGNIVLGVVNIFGDLIGDIILPEEELNTPLANAGNTGNGSGSTNSTLVDNEINNTTLQTNEALIQNNLEFEANTGGNHTSKNTGGNSTIETGGANIDSQTINIANSNVEGGNWWLVIVNKAGQWVGQILGAPKGADTAGSAGTTFTSDSQGNITATNSGNGAGSSNTASADSTSNNTTAQTNNAKIINNIDLSANTGNNSASRNTGGDSTIKTGDANIVTNLVNFVNNNIANGDRLTVTIVNVFGSWIGDFVTPGQHKTAANGGRNADQNPADPPANQIQDPSLNQSASQTSASGQTADQPQLDSTAIATDPVASDAPKSSSISYDNNSTEQQTLVAGVKIDNNDSGPSAQPITPNTPNSRQVMELNLAWLLLLLPFGGITLFIKHRVN